MATLRQNVQAIFRGEAEVRFSPTNWVRENILRSWWLALWLVILTYITLVVVLNQFDASPVVTGVVVLVWAVSVGATAVSDITRQHGRVTHWLKGNLYSSITNVQLTLILALLLIALVRIFWRWAVVCASWTTDAEQAAQNLTKCDPPGANWGAVIDNFRNLMVYLFPVDESWRILLVLVLFVALLIPSFFIYREQYRRSRIRRIWTILWLLSPIVFFGLLLGVQPVAAQAVLISVGVIAGLLALSYLTRWVSRRSSSLFVLVFIAIVWVAAVAVGVYLLVGQFRITINPQQFWGGLLLTLVLSIFAIVASFPLGVFLALGRRSTIRGIPAWLTWLVAIGIAIWGLIFSTPELLAAARNPFETLLAFWPVYLLLVAYLFQRYFQGNVVSLLSTVYIETVRGVPFITILFMSIILFPIFLPPGMEILGTWRVMVATALFSAAYLAENVRGGLQSIPKGQYEAGDSVGLNTVQKYRLIILPQALRVVIPAIVGQFIGLYKDTTLVAIVGLVDLLGAANQISAQPDWLGVRREPYVFIAIIYYVGSAVMAGYSRRLESQLGVGER